MQQATNQIQKLMPSRSGEEEYELVLTASKINQSTNEEIKQSLRYAMILVGIRAASISAMEEEEKIILVNFLKTQFGWHTVEEIKLAFTKACSGELDVDARPFENFTCEYIGRIMKAYKEWVTEKSLRLKSKQNQERYKTYELLTTPRSDGIELGEIYYQEFLKGEFNFKTATSLCWDNLKQTFGITLSQERNLEIIKLAKELYILDQDQIINTYSKGLYKLNAENAKRYVQTDDIRELLDTSGIMTYCKRLGLVDWFTKLKESGYTSIVEYKKEFDQQKNNP
jgi:hypothetical protein